MPGLTETELMASYDKTLPPTATMAESSAPSVQPRMIRVGARVCLRGHILINGGHCRTCHGMAAKKLAERRPKKTRCTKGHQLTADNVVETKRTRANGTGYVQRSCLTCMKNREVAKGLKHPQSSRFQRAKAKALVEEIDDYMLTMADRIELMPRHEIAQWNVTRLAMLKKKDDLVKRYHFA